MLRKPLTHLKSLGIRPLFLIQAKLQHLLWYTQYNYIANQNTYVFPGQKRRGFFFFFPVKISFHIAFAQFSLHAT
jgi:hypothetical protein